MMKVLLENWANGKCPILNGVIFPDGTFYPIEPVDAPRNTLPLMLRYGSAQQKLPADLTQWTHVAALCEFADKSRGILAIAGECGMGADGFVSLLTPDGVLRWNAFFDFSNPFVALRLDEDCFVAENNYGEYWRIPLATPWQITIERPERPFPRGKGATG